MKYIVGINGLYRADAIDFRINKWYNSSDELCCSLGMCYNGKKIDFEYYTIPSEKDKEILIDLAKAIVESPSGIIMSEFLKKWRE